jgi:TPR repeat protein
MRSLTATVLACVLVAPIHAQDHEAGIEAFRRGDFAAALVEWRPLAERGHSGAQHRLGIMYEYGRGVERDDRKAVQWYTKAAVQGVAGAQYRLGVLYDNGWGVPESDIDAVKWYREAATQGDPLAQHDLGFMYAAGTGVAQDYVRAYMWLEIAVEQGNGFMATQRRLIGENLTPAQIREAKRMARVWAEGERR